MGRSLDALSFLEPERRLGAVPAGGSGGRFPLELLGMGGTGRREPRGVRTAAAFGGIERCGIPSPTSLCRTTDASGATPRDDSDSPVTRLYRRRSCAGWRRVGGSGAARAAPPLRRAPGGCRSRRKPRMGATSTTAFSSTQADQGARIRRRGAMRCAVSCGRRRSWVSSRRSLGTSMTAMSRVSKRAPAARAILCRRLRAKCPASPAANIRTGPGGAKCRRHGTPVATARSIARMDLPHSGSPPPMPTAARPTACRPATAARAAAPRLRRGVQRRVRAATPRRRYAHAHRAVPGMAARG